MMKNESLSKISSEMEEEVSRCLRGGGAPRLTQPQVRCSNFRAYHKMDVGCSPESISLDQAYRFDLEVGPLVIQSPLPLAGFVGQLCYADPTVPITVCKEPADGSSWGGGGA